MTQETVEQAIQRTGKRGKIVFRSCLCVALLGVIGMTNTCTLYYSLCYSDRWSGKVVAQWKQPDDVEHDKGAPFYISAIERDLDWRPLTVLASPQRNYSIYAGRRPGTPTHGHFIDFTFFSGDDDDFFDEVSYIKKANVEWSPEGATMTMTSGHKLFIPQRYFTGGR